MKARIPPALRDHRVRIEKSSTTRDLGGGISDSDVTATVLVDKFPMSAKALADSDRMWSAQFAEFVQWQCWADAPPALDNTCTIILEDGRRLKVRQALPRGDRLVLVLALEVAT